MPFARRFLVRAADAAKPHVAAMTATASSRAISCGGPSDPIRNLRAVVWFGPLARSNHRLRRTSIVNHRFVTKASEKR
jgi:hypothetical protein